ncbi:helix-turn-helix transcriptional regulator [Nocardia sp. NPDC088792]|uniref:helix-turn-helix transcriptional regulator n=1 Tax=Nocardia sp. NPDC088792 TaxID=3364332 RepID=UPI0038261693
MKQQRREQLRHFLRTRRARIAPGDVGLVSVGQRRTPGLRREEVALLAGVGVSWYTWLEQGRRINVSGDVLDAVSRALRLDETERAHLFVLAGLNPPLGQVDPGTEVSPELRRLVDSWSPRPATLRDQYFNLLAINDGSRAVYGYGDGDYNCLVSFFTNTRYRSMYDEWAANAPSVVAAFRASADRSPGDPGFDRLVAELRTVSKEFGELWDRHDVATPQPALKAVRHPEAGELLFDTVTLAVVDHPDWYLELYNPQPGTRTEERLAVLMDRQPVSA